MKLSKTIEITLYVLIVGLVVLFSFAIEDKLFDFDKFKSGLQNSPFIPVWAAGTVAVVTIGSFFAISILLLAGFWKQRLMGIGLWATTGLFLVFTLYIVSILTVAPYEPCVCIGLNEKLKLNWKSHLLLNGLLLASIWSATMLYYANKKFIAINEAPSQPLKNGKFLKRKEV